MVFDLISFSNKLHIPYPYQWDYLYTYFFLSFLILVKLADLAETSAVIYVFSEHDVLTLLYSPDETYYNRRLLPQCRMRCGIFKRFVNAEILINHSIQAVVDPKF